MTKAKEQLHRQWALLQKIPVRPSGVTARQLTEALENEGYSVTKRMIERDLVDLRDSPFGVSCDEKASGNNPNRWYFERDAKLHLLPAMSMQMAFTLLFARRVLSDMIPPSILHPLRPMLDKAANTLRVAKNPYRNWERFVRHIPRVQPLIPAKINQDVLEGCLDATLHNYQLQITYSPRYDDIKEYLVNPLGIVYRDSVIYLVCTLWKYTDIRHLAMHRVKKLVPRKDHKSIMPKGFDLDDYISSEGAFLYNQSPGKTISVHLKFDIDTALHLEETPLSEDQKIIKRDDYALLTATVADTNQLRWWLMGFGPYVEILKPGRLREEFKEASQSMANLYTN